MRKKVVLVAAVVSSVLLAGFCLLFVISVIFADVVFADETVTIRFNSYQELSNSGYMNNGWFPSDFPQNTMDIVKTYNIDSNHVWVESLYNGNLEFGGRQMEELDEAEIPGQFDLHFKIDSKNTQVFRISGYEYLAIDEINENLGKLYYYRNGSEEWRLKKLELN